MNNQYDDMLEALDALRQRGFTKSFSMAEGGLYCTVKEKVFRPEDVHIEEFHRFEGATNPTDMAIIYAIVTNDGCRGVVIDAFGTYANSRLGEFLKQAVG